MKWKNLGDPYPHQEPKPYRTVEWQEGQELKFGAELALDVDSSPASRAERYFDVVRTRRTRYDLAPLDLPTLGSLFSLTDRVAVRCGEPFGFPLSQRPAPSAGAIHPIHIVIHLPHYALLHRYDPFAHCLREIYCEIDLAALRSAMNAVVPGGDGVLLLFVAEPGRTFAKYAHASSLVWRDAGILQGYFSIAAEALAVNFVALGVSGEPWASQLVKEVGLAGVGAAFLGTRSPQERGR